MERLSKDEDDSQLQLKTRQCTRKNVSLVPDTPICMNIYGAWVDEAGVVNRHDHDFYLGFQGRF